jgi:hypothetical protein
MTDRTTEQRILEDLEAEIDAAIIRARRRLAKAEAAGLPGVRPDLRDMRSPVHAPSADWDGSARPPRSRGARTVD